MDTVKRSTVTTSKSKLARNFAKVLQIKAVTEIAPDDEIQKTLKKEQVKKIRVPCFENKDLEPLQNTTIKEAFLAKLFASISTIKATYAQLQFVQSPYDADGIQSADNALVSELKNLSELKQSYLKDQLKDTSPETTLIKSEIQEQKSLIQMYEITNKKLDSQLKLKDSEIIFLKEKLAEVNSDNKSLEKRLNSSGQMAMFENARLLSLMPCHFVACFKKAIKSIRSFVGLLIMEMELANWDLDSAVSSIEPDVSFWKPSHKCFVFESYVCREMFDGFDCPNFSTDLESLFEKENRHRLYFEKFMELKSVGPGDYLAWKPKSLFAKFCRSKYLRLFHPKMEASLFGNLDQRNLVNSGELPETPFFSAFTEMAKRIWLLQCLALSFDPEVSIFQVSKGTRFSEVYMESISDEVFLSVDPTSKIDPHVAFMVVPGFMIGKTVVQCQVYLY